MYSIDFLDIPPLASAGGSVRLPGSKSISNRALLLAALAREESTLHHVLDSDDTRVMLTALEQLGCAIGPHTGEAAAAGGWQNALASGQPLRIRGLDGKLPPFDDVREIFLGNAGTAMRPLTATLAVLGGHFVLDGVARMRERPIGDLLQALRQLGCRVDCTGQEGYPPLRIRPPVFTACAEQQAIAVRGDVSSQFLTALLMALPLLPGAHVVEVEGELISRPYIRITLELMARFGVRVAQEGWQRFTIPASSRYQAPGDFVVEPDASSASYFLALGAIAPGTDGIRIEGLGHSSIQGDIAFAQAAARMGASIDISAQDMHACPAGAPLHGVDIDCTHIPDAAMTLAIMALHAKGTTTLRGIASWRVKETDRIAAMAAELRKLGAQAQEGPDFLRITPPASAQDWKAASIHTYDDHRMAMCFALAAFNPAGVPVRIQEPRCVGKTFPDYFETLFSVCRARPERIPVLCVDGPGACGKGTLAAGLSRALGWHLLDSGALYRAAALAVLRAGLQDRPEAAAAHIARLAHPGGRGGGLRLDAAQRVWLRQEGQDWEDWEDVSEAIRVEAVGMCASSLAAVPQVRAALVDMQRACLRLPGLVADGRDMGSHIFPDAPLKVYLTASVECRAQRRMAQLERQGIATTMPALLADLQARDARDSQRGAAPLHAARDSLLLDSTDLSAEQVLAQVLAWWQARQPFDAN